MTIETGIGHCWITFDNGYTLSIFNGMGSYSENRLDFDTWNKALKTGDIRATYESKDVEIAIIKDDEFVTSEILDVNDNVKGFVSIKELLEIINKVKNI